MDWLQAGIWATGITFFFMAFLLVIAVTTPEDIICEETDSGILDGEYNASSSDFFADMENCHTEPNMFQMIAGPFILLFIVLALVTNIIASVEIIRSKKAALGKLLWLFLIWIVFNILATFGYYFFGREKK